MTYREIPRTTAHSQRAKTRRNWTAGPIEMLQIYEKERQGIEGTTLSVRATI